MRLALALAALLALGPAVALAKPAPAAKCAAAKRKATAKKIAAKLGCQAQAVLRNVAVDPLCVAKAESVFAKAFQRAESKGGCVGGDATTVEGIADACVADVVAQLPGAGTTTTTLAQGGSTTTTVPAVCGNGVLEFPEECDDGGTTSSDGCDATCHLEPTQEVEPNDTGQTSQSLGAAPKMVAGSLSSITDVDFFAFTLGSPAGLHIEVSDTGGVGSCATLHTHIFLYDSIGQDIVGDYDSGALDCSLLDPALNPEVANLAAGTYVVKIDPNGTSGGSYQLRIIPR